MRERFRLTTAVYPAMGVMLASSFLLSSRTRDAQSMVTDHVFPLLRLRHPAGEGTFFPGSFALNFLLPSLALMLALNLALPGRFRPLLSGRVNLFYYLLVLILAILEIGADTLLTLIALPGRYAFGGAVSVVHAGFITALALAAVVTRGADRDW